MDPTKDLLGGPPLARYNAKRPLRAIEKWTTVEIAVKTPDRREWIENGAIQKENTKKEKKRKETSHIIYQPLDS